MPPTGKPPCMAGPREMLHTAESGRVCAAVSGSSVSRRFARYALAVAKLWVPDKVQFSFPPIPGGPSRCGSRADSRFSRRLQRTCPLWPRCPGAPGTPSGEAKPVTLAGPSQPARPPGRRRTGRASPRRGPAGENRCDRPVRFSCAVGHLGLPQRAGQVRSGRKGGARGVGAAGQPRGDLLDQPSVAVRVGEGAEGPVAGVRGRDRAAGPRLRTAGRARSRSRRYRGRPGRRGLRRCRRRSARPRPSRARPW